jgi:anti-anti-sigma regulatory factor
MEAYLKRHGDITVISIQGPLTIEETQPFREACLKHLVGQKVVFNMARANFVGSTGLQAFMETIKAFDQGSTHGVRFVAAKSEFRRMISNLEAKRVEFFEQENHALKEWPLLCEADSTLNLAPDLISLEIEE